MWFKYRALEVFCKSKLRGIANSTNILDSSCSQLLNDVTFNADIHRLAIRRVQAAAQPTFLYRFSVEDEYNLGRARRRLDRAGQLQPTCIVFLSISMFDL